MCVRGPGEAWKDCLFGRGHCTKITYSHCTFTNLQKSQCFQAGCCCSFELLEGEAASVCQLLEGMGSLSLQFRSPGGTGDGSFPTREACSLPSLLLGISGFRNSWTQLQPFVLLLLEPVSEYRPWGIKTHILLRIQIHSRAWRHTRL